MYNLTKIKVFNLGPNTFLRLRGKTPCAKTASTSWLANENNMSVLYLAKQSSSLVVSFPKHDSYFEQLGKAPR